MNDDHWMQGAVKHPGAFTKKAKAAGMSDHAFAVKVTNNPKKYDEQTVRQANLCLTFEHAARKMRGTKKIVPSVEQVKGVLQ